MTKELVEQTEEQKLRSFWQLHHRVPYVYCTESCDNKAQIKKRSHYKSLKNWAIEIEAN